MEKGGKRKQFEGKNPSILFFSTVESLFLK
jgi:hypothetical protein